LNLRNAVENVDPIAVQSALQTGANVHSVDWKNATILHVACNLADTSSSSVNEDQLLQVIQILLHAGVNSATVDKLGQSPLDHAAARGRVRVIQLLLLQQQQQNGCSFRGTPLHAASRAEKLQAVQVLLNAGADPTAQDSRGDAALHAACSGGHLEIVNVLLDHHHHRHHNKDLLLSLNK